MPRLRASRKRVHYLIIFFIFFIFFIIFLKKTRRKRVIDPSGKGGGL